MNLFLGVVYMEMELGLGMLSIHSRFLQKGGTKLRAAAYGIYIIRLETSIIIWYLFGRGTYNNGNIKVHSEMLVYNKYLHNGSGKQIITSDTFDFHAQVPIGWA